MNYKLAKQLKDAGFPQDKARFSYVFPPKCPKGYTNIMEVSKPQGMLNLLATGYDIVACPSLEELIDECGDGFMDLLNLEEDGWRAFAKGYKKQAKAKTPSEAVAELWLKLNSTII